MTGPPTVSGHLAGRTRVWGAPAVHECEPLLARGLQVALGYFLMCYPLSRYSQHLEKSLRGDKQ